MGGGGKGGKGDVKAEIPRYHLSIHAGFCMYGPDLKLLELHFGEKLGWSGEHRDGAVIDIDRENHFGGIKKEGGVSGHVAWLPGDPQQTMPTGLASRFRPTFTQENCPGFRGVASLFFFGRGNTSGDVLNSLFKGAGGSTNASGFYWGASNPYLKPIWAKFRRPSQGLNPSISLIRLPDNRAGKPQFASNAAHMVYECLTNREWGMGHPPAGIDIYSYEEAAQTLYDEGFGLSALWVRQTSIEQFITEILDHIHATQFINPRTGKLTLKLLRRDYDLDNLFEISPDNADLSNYQRQLWGDSANEIVVSWTNPENEEEETVTAQDIASVAMQGGIVSDGRNYYMARSVDLAARLAERDLSMSAMPLATCEAEINREAWHLVPGEVCLLTWPERGIERLVVRCGKVDYDKAKAGRVRVQLYEDVFGREAARYLSPSTSSWEDPSADPRPIEYMMIRTAPAYQMAQALGLNEPAEIDYPDAITVIAAADPTMDGTDWQLLGPETMPNGEVVTASYGTRQFASRGVLSGHLPAASHSLTSAFNTLSGPEPAPGQFLVIAGNDEHGDEICYVEAEEVDGLRLLRGLLDTIPREWPAGSVFWVQPMGGNMGDLTVRAIEESTTYKALPATSRGRLDPEDAEEFTVTVSNRAHLPIRPANVRLGAMVGGTMRWYNHFGPVPLPAGTESFTVTWHNRNVELETVQVHAWDAPPLSLEPNTYVRVTAYDPNGGVLWMSGNLTGNQTSVTLSQLQSATEFTLKVACYKVLGGTEVESLQSARLNVLVG